MEREYDLFEQFPDGSQTWRGQVRGILELRGRLADLSQSTKNECLAMHLPTQEVVARMNVGGELPEIAKQLVCQVAYDPIKAKARTRTLRANAYEVVTVMGNESAKLVLDLCDGWSAFIVADSASQNVRQEMVSWLKSKFPAIPVVALNPATAPMLPGADYNVRHDAELWLPLLAIATRHPPAKGTAWRKQKPS